MFPLIARHYVSSNIERGAYLLNRLHPRIDSGKPGSLRSHSTSNNTSQMPTIEISKQSAQEFKAAVDHILHADPYSNTQEKHIWLGDALKESLKSSEVSLLERLGDHGDPAILFVKGAPIGASTENPLRDQRNVSAWFIHALANALGTSGHTLKTSPNEHGGRLVHDIAPDPNNSALRATNSSHGKKALGFHTENPYTLKHPGYPGPPDALILLGIRQDPTAATGLLPIKKIVEELAPETRAELQKNNFVFRSGASHAKLEEVQSPILQPQEDGNRSRFRFLSQNIGPNRLVPTTEKAGVALQALEATIAKLHETGAVPSVKLNAGEGVIFNNGSFESGGVGGALHARIGHITNNDRLVKRGLAYNNTVSRES